MPQKDRYHDTVVRALEKDGWRIEDEQITLGNSERRIYLDILARRSATSAIFVEVKGFENMASPLTYLMNAVGQYLVYEAILDYLRIAIPLYLAVPAGIYRGYLSETITNHILRYAHVKMLLYDLESEAIVEWKT